jgi:mono/diheme cytochrome c family protein
MLRFLLGLVIGLVIIPIAGFLYVFLGYAPVATSAAPLPLEKRITHAAMNARIAKEAPRSSPLPATDENYQAGALIYHQNCETCHGSPGRDADKAARSMFPNPPQLWKGKGVTDDPVGETWWKVANGIRLSGMPSFDGTLNRDQQWQVSLLLANADKVSDKVRAIAAGQ